MLILAKLAGFSSTGAKALLLLKTADRGISAQDLDHALKSYDQLQVATAQRVLGFYRTRHPGPVAPRLRLSSARLVRPHDLFRKSATFGITLWRAPDARR